MNELIVIVLSSIILLNMIVLIGVLMILSYLYRLICWYIYDKEEYGKEENEIKNEKNN